MAKKILLVTGDAVEALELIYPYYRCLEEGFEATIAAPKRKRLQTVVHDFEAHMETYTEKPAYGIDSHIAFSEVDPAAYDGLIVPGGRAPEYIRLDPHLPAIVAHFFNEHKPVATICHGSQVLATIGDLIKGRSMVAYSACRPDVEACGAHYVSEPFFVESNLVSAHAWPDLPSFMREFLKLMNR